MLTSDQESYLLENAYVPEHITGLMVPVSKGEAFIVSDYLAYAKDNWLIFVGYPLTEAFSDEGCEAAVEETVRACRPEYAWFIGPRVPPALLENCAERQSDSYYRLDLGASPPAALMRQAEKASAALRIERSRTFGKKHDALIAEFVKRVKKLPPMIRELYRAMPEYVATSDAAALLSAYDRKEKLSALFVVDLAPRRFATYVLGCYSRKRYVAHASDLLFREMIDLAKREGKEYINLGLGVNDGIRRFKEKWGGAPFLAYEFCEKRFVRPRVHPLMRLLRGRA